MKHINRTIAVTMAMGLFVVSEPTQWTRATEDKPSAY
jgi:hypothetical protein